jgi:RND family efflux transporter MFP subunit
MKTAIIVLVTLLIGLGAGYAIFNQSEAQTLTETSSGKQLYTCGMHPEIISDEPGYCPICGMKLTPKKDGGNTAAEGSIVIDPTTVHNIGLETVSITSMPITKSIRAFGEITYSEPMVRTVNVKVPGWVENLYADYEGMDVKKGQPLLKLYSPELVAAQREYLVAYKTDTELSQANSAVATTSSSLLDAAVMRLKNWDISGDQIQGLATSGDLTKTMLIRSPYDGIVVSKLVNQGDHLKGGVVAYKIADISNVWVEAFVYEQDVPFLKVGQKAAVRVPSLPDKRFEAIISYISPYLNRDQQIEIRLDVKYPNLILKPGMYAEVNLESGLPGNRLTIPLQAVINSGAKQVVYVANDDGSFMPKLIETGAVGDNETVEVLSGLNPSDRVVVSGQFLLDSESRLNESLAFTHSHGGHMGSDNTQADHMDMEMDDGHDNQDQIDADHSSMDNDNMKMEHDKTSKDDKSEGELSGIYTCPMPEHHHVLQYGPGSCPECGMKLVPIEQTDIKEVYVCPMEQDSVVSDKPGKCPECGMNLVKLETKKEPATKETMQKAPGDNSKDKKQAEAELSGVYTCPMPSHYDVLHYGPGNCPECGMKLVPVEKTDNTEVYVCPMPEDKYVANEPGNCPVCGMKLTKLD